MTIRPPAVAGRFYPADPAVLREQILAYLRDATPTPGPAPKALIAPHAGYVYSGAIAASAYASVAAERDRITRVILLGPAHYVAVSGLALPGADYYGSPLGALALDREALERLSELPQVVTSGAAHAREHSLEVHIPFLQLLFGDTLQIVPLAVGQAAPEQVAEVLSLLWAGPETLIVISSDLSHYLSYEQACAVDARTAQRITALDPGLSGHEACGAVPINGLLLEAQRRDLRVRCQDLRNSGDTAGSRDHVVGYGAFTCYEHPLAA